MKVNYKNQPVGRLPVRLHYLPVCIPKIRYRIDWCHCNVCQSLKVRGVGVGTKWPQSDTDWRLIRVS